MSSTQVKMSCSEYEKFKKICNVKFQTFLWKKPCVQTQYLVDGYICEDMVQTTLMVCVWEKSTDASRQSVIE